MGSRKVAVGHSSLANSLSALVDPAMTVISVIMIIRGG
mgnify:CR=1 FL=1